jgi:glycerol-3-phosphate acyltransferase PlsY
MQIKNVIHLFILFGYVCGAIPFGILFARIFGLGDIRKIGSGNIGATNVLRTGNYIAAILTLMFDFIKGFIPVWLYIYANSLDIFASLVALSVVVGHVFSIFLKFKGGKGVATAAGACCALNSMCFCVGLVSWLVVFLASKTSSLSSLISLCAVLPLCAAIITVQNYDMVAILLFAVANAVIIIFTHITNIKRLLNKEELCVAKNRK